MITGRAVSDGFDPGFHLEAKIHIPFSRAAAVVVEYKYWQAEGDLDIDGFDPSTLDPIDLSGSMISPKQMENLKKEIIVCTGPFLRPIPFPIVQEPRKWKQQRRLQRSKVWPTMNCLLPFLIHLTFSSRVKVQNDSYKQIDELIKNKG